MSQFKTSTVNGKGPSLPQQPDPEVVPRGKRRQFSATYKLGILQEAERCEQPGQMGALLRREGLYSSQLSEWRRERQAGELQGLAAKVRGRQRDEQAAESAALRRENEQLKAQLAQAAPRGLPIIAAQKKLAQVLEQTLTPNKEIQS